MVIDIRNRPLNQGRAAALAEVVGLALPEDGPGSGVEVVLASERRLRLSPGFDADTLRRAVPVLESLPC